MHVVCSPPIGRAVQSLRKLSGLLEAEGMAGGAGLVWLLDCSANISDAQLDSFAAYGTGIGPEKARVRLLALLLTSIAAMPEHRILVSEMLMLRHSAGQLSAHNIRCDCCIKPCCQHTHEHAEKVTLKPLGPCRAWWRRW